MKWFKFYGQDYLSDPKILMLSPAERSCWITLLCYASVNDNGMITFLTEEKLMFQAGLDPTREEWDFTSGVLEKFKTLQMITYDNDLITVKNWNKRQETSLTSYERVKRFREKKRIDNAKITLEENRIEENRIDTNTNTFIHHDEIFNQFWDKYPKKVGKNKTLGIWQRKKLESQLPVILDFIEKASVTDRWRKGFIPDPTTFLNQERWNDGLEFYNDKQEQRLKIKKY